MIWGQASDLEKLLHSEGLSGGHLSGRGEFSLLLLMDCWRLLNQQQLLIECALQGTFTGKWMD